MIARWRLCAGGKLLVDLLLPSSQACQLLAALPWCSDASLGPLRFGARRLSFLVVVGEVALSGNQARTSTMTSVVPAKL